MRTIEPAYDSSTDWKLDPNGYCIIKVFYRTIATGGSGRVKTEGRDGHLGVRHYPAPAENPSESKWGVAPEADAEIVGTDAYKILQTLVKEGLVTSEQHAAYLGYELMKAEVALRLDLEYVQDEHLDFTKKRTKDVSENVRNE